MFASTFADNDDDNRSFQEVQWAPEQASNLSQLTVKALKHFAQTAQQAISIIADIKLSHEEKEPSLSASLLTLHGANIAELRRQTEEMVQEHEDLQFRVHCLRAGAHRQQIERKHAMAQAVAAASMPEKTLKHSDSVCTASTSCTTAGSSSSNDLSDDDLDTLLPSADRCDGGDSDAETFDAHKVLEPVHEAVQCDLTFWRCTHDRMQKLSQQRQHTSCLVACTSGSSNLRLRIEQRLDEYQDSWSSLHGAIVQRLSNDGPRIY